MEIWKDIKNYEGKYQISNYGNVKVLSRRVNDYRGGRIKKERLLHSTDNGNGYLIITLPYENKKKNYYIHRLVAEAFIEIPENKKYVNHKDYNKKNNYVDNLEWCTQKENVLYSINRMKHARNKYKISKTGEKYISIKRGRYRVNIRQNKIDKSFKTIEEAKEFKEIVLKGVTL